MFVDTNILLYAGRNADPFSEAACNTLGAAEDAGAELCISRQVLREYLAVVTRQQITVGLMPDPAAHVQQYRLPTFQQHDTDRRAMISIRWQARGLDASPSAEAHA